MFFVLSGNKEHDSYINKYFSLFELVIPAMQLVLFCLFFVALALHQFDVCIHIMYILMYILYIYYILHFLN